MARSFGPFQGCQTKEMEDVSSCSHRQQMKRPVDSKETQNPRYPVRGTLISSCCESELEALEFAEMIAQNCIFISGWTIEEKTEALGWVPVQQ